MSKLGIALLCLALVLAPFLASASNEEEMGREAQEISDNVGEHAHTDAKAEECGESVKEAAKHERQEVGEDVKESEEVAKEGFGEKGEGVKDTIEADKERVEDTTEDAKDETQTWTTWASQKAQSFADAATRGAGEQIYGLKDHGIHMAKETGEQLSSMKEKLASYASGNEEVVSGAKATHREEEEEEEEEKKGDEL